MSKTIDVNKLMADIRRFSLSPSGILQAQLDAVQDVLEDKVIVDPSNPTILNWEMSATAAAAHITESRALVRTMFKKLAQTENDLAHHMSDRQRIGLWATPSSSEVVLMLPYEEVLAAAERFTYPDGTFLYRLYIPEYSFMEVNAERYGLYHGIWIDVMQNGSMSCYWDLSNTNPISNRVNNYVDSRLIVNDGIRWLEMTFPVDQFSIDSNTYSIDGTTSFKRSIAYDDRFFHIRAFMDNGDDNWQEIGVTHSSEVYDLERPTVMYEVLDGVIVTMLPDIYQTKGLVGKNIRLDVYTTLGEQTKDYREVTQENIELHLDNKYNFENPQFTTPFDKIARKIMYFSDTVTGGRNALSFEDQRSRVIYNIDHVNNPVTYEQLYREMKEYGFILQRMVDNLTDATYVASKLLPSTEVDGLNRRVNAMLGWVSLNETSTEYQRSVKINGEHVILTPDAWFKREGTIVRLLSDIELSEFELLRDTNPVAFVRELNENTYLKTPFHYVLDLSRQRMYSNAYLLTRPTANRKSFVARNNTIDIGIETRDVSIRVERDTATGDISHYVLSLTGVIPSDFLANDVNAVYAQIAINGMDGTTAYLHGDIAEQTKSTVTWEFPLETPFDVDTDGTMFFSNFVDKMGLPTEVNIPLKSEIVVYYAIRRSFTTMRPASFQNEMGYIEEETTIGFVGCTKEIMDLELGRSQDLLYVPNRSILGNRQYRRYENDVQAVYTQDVYKPDPTTGYEITEEGELVLLHEVGESVWEDPMKTIPVIAHRKGDLILDLNGQAIPLEGQRNIERLVGITLLDARYHVANTPGPMKMYEDAIEQINAYLDGDIARMQGKIIEQHKLRYKPRGMLGDVVITIPGGLETVIPNRIDFSVDVQMTRKGLRDVDQQLAINERVRSIINETLEERILSISDIIPKLRSVMGEDVVSFDIARFGPKRDLGFMSLADEGTNFILNERLVIRADGRMDMEDTVQIRYNLYE